MKATTATRNVLTVVGDLVTDVVVRPKGPVRHGTDNTATIHHTRGGSAANVAAAAATLVPTRFIGRVGEDPAGERLAAELADCGVALRLQRDGRTGTVVVIVDDDGERTMYPDRASAGELDTIDPSWLEQTAVLHLPAYGFGTAPMTSALLSAARTVRADGGRVSVDVAAVTLVEALGRDRVDAVLAELRPAIVFANDAEADSLDLRNRTPPTGGRYVIKAGAEPATIISDDGSVERVAPAPLDDVTDTTGAGDAFAAGYLAAWMRGATPAEAAAAGHTVAADAMMARCIPT